MSDQRESSSYSQSRNWSQNNGQWSRMSSQTWEHSPIQKQQQASQFNQQQQSPVRESSYHQPQKPQQLNQRNYQHQSQQQQIPPSLAALFASGSTTGSVFLGQQQDEKKKQVVAALEESRKRQEIIQHQLIAHGNQVKHFKAQLDQMPSDANPELVGNMRMKLAAMETHQGQGTEALRKEVARGTSLRNQLELLSRPLNKNSYSQQQQQQQNSDFSLSTRSIIPGMQHSTQHNNYNIPPKPAQHRQRRRLFERTPSLGSTGDISRGIQSSLDTSDISLNSQSLSTTNQNSLNGISRQLLSALPSVSQSSNNTIGMKPLNEPHHNLNTHVGDSSLIERNNTNLQSRNPNSVLSGLDFIQQHRHVMNNPIRNQLSHNIRGDPRQMPTVPKIEASSNVTLVNAPGLGTISVCVALDREGKKPRKISKHRRENVAEDVQNYEDPRGEECICSPNTNLIVTWEMEEHVGFIIHCITN